MISILGTVLGLFGSFIPELLKVWKAKADHKHELAVLKVQVEMAKSEHLYRIEEIHAQADVASEQAVYKQAEIKYTGVRWVDGILALYSGTIRPTITYLFMGFYMFVKYAQLQIITSQGASLWQTVWQLWSSDDMAAFMTIIGFWFGGRLLKHNLAAFGVKGQTNGDSPPVILNLQPIPVVPKPEDKPNDASTDNSTGFYINTGI